MNSVKKWDIFEAAFEGPRDGNPFVDVELCAVFFVFNRRIEAEGFYDGDGVYRLRFMPDTEGEWSYVTKSNAPALNGLTGGFTCVAPDANAHGPVRVDSGCLFRHGNFGVTSSTRFCYADGLDYQPVGTTCYVWNLQGDALEEQTLATLAKAPFNKIRFCVFPKHYDFNHNDPESYPFEGKKGEGWDFARFNPAYFRHLEMRIGQLRELGIEADLILFHPYDRGEWGFDRMPHDVDVRYLRYLCARISCYRNVWWSLANEYDLMPEKSMADWDDFFRTLMNYDPYDHLRSIHNCRGFYDHSKGWVTHASVQSSELNRVSEWMTEYGKPVVVDECCYEGNIHHPWGNISPEEMVNRMWIGFARGAFVGHGETYMDSNDVLWWSKGGVLHGESPARIAFLRKFFAALPGKPMTIPAMGPFGFGETGCRIEDDYLLYYYEDSQPIRKRVRLPEGKTYRAEVIDAWNMTVTPVEGEWSGECELDMPGRSYCALAFTRIGN